MNLKTFLFLIVPFILGSRLDAFSQRVLPAEKIYLSTDRYYFDPSEYVDYALFLSTDSEATPKSVKVKVWLENARGKTLDSSIVHTFNNEVGGIFQLPAKGGIYYLKAISVYQQNYIKINPVVKELFVQESVTANFFVDIKLGKNNYGSQAVVTSDITCTAAGNKTTEYVPVTVRMLKDGSPVEQEILKTDNQGKVTSSLTLPEFANSSESSFYLTASCEYRGKMYSQTFKIPTSERKAIITLFYDHGNEGFLPKIENQLIVKSTDEYGNTLDIKGKLVTTAGKLIKSFESYAEGMGSIPFIPNSAESYLLISGNDTIPLAEAEIKKGLSTKEEKRTLVVETTGSQTENFQLVVSHRGKVLVEELIRENSSSSIPVSTPGIYAASLLLNGVTVARRDYFVGYDHIRRTQISLKDSVTTSRDFKYIDVANASQQIQHYSISIVKENNLKQIENKSHNSMTWLLLGSEYATEIERPQRYFDPKNKKAKKTLDLLMNTLHSASMRDALSGKMKAHSDREVSNSYRIGGRLRVSGYSQYLSTKKVRIQIKNTNIITYTDSVGNFELDIPAGFSKPLVIIARKGFSATRYLATNSLHTLKDYSPAFAVQLPIKDLAEVSIPKNQKLAESSVRMGIKYTPLRQDRNSEERVSYMSPPPLRRSNDLMSMPAATSNVEIASVAVRSLSSYYYYYQPSGIEPNFDMYLSTPHYQEPYYITLTPKRVQSNSTPSMRYNKKATVYWKPHHKSKERKGSRINTSFNPPIGGYRITVEGIDGKGDFIYGEKYFVVKEKLDVETNIPKQLYVGDQASIPVSITNNLDTISQAIVQIKGVVNQKDTIELRPLETLHLSYPIGQQASVTSVKSTVWVLSDGFNFNATETVVVGSYKIQENENIGGIESRTKLLNLSNAEPSSIVSSFEIYPSFNKQVMEIAQNLLRQPGGCFEQVSSSNYPNIAAMLLMRSANDKRGSAYRRAQQYVQSGYRQLAAYETPSGGFEWYGRNPPHESLTAYGLLQFHLIKEVGFTIDEQQYERTINWLLSRRDFKGGFKFHAGKYGFRSAPYEVNNAYITWVLSRISSHNIQPQLAAVEKDLRRNFDAYKMALLVNSLYEKQEFDKARDYYMKLRKHILQQNFADFKAEKSVVNAYGASLDAEVRALALMAAMAANDMDFAVRLKAAILKSTNGRGYFGSTQATALSLEALARLGMQETEQYASEYTVFINGEEALSVDYSKDKIMEHTLKAYLLKPDINTIEIKTNGQSVPYNLKVKWIEKRSSNIHPELDFKVSYAKDSILKGEYNLLSIAVQNTLSQAKGQVVATVNIPETYSISTEELRNMLRTKEIDYYELDGNTLHLYFLEMGPKEKKLLTLNLKANYEGSYHSGAHEVFEYYHPETVSKCISPLTVVK